MGNIIKIPKKLTKKAPYSLNDKRGTKVYHYEYVKTSKHVVIYKCLETGTLECFQKKDFIDKKGNNYVF